MTSATLEFGLYRNRLERGAGFTPLTLRSHDLDGRRMLFSIVLGGTTVLPWNRGTSFSRYQYRRGHGTTVVSQYH